MIPYNISQIVKQKKKILQKLNGFNTNRFSNKKFDLNANINNNNNNNISEECLLCDESKYDSLKYEILNNKMYKLNMNQFKISLHKINKYFRSKKVRKMIGDWRVEDM